MKFLIHLCVLCTLSLSAWSNDSIPPCDAPCMPPVPWTYSTLSDTLSGSCDSCHFLVKYWWRDCSGTIEVVMGEITTWGDCTTHGCESWLNWYVFDYVIRMNPATQARFILHHDSCVTNIQAGTPTCYMWVDSGGPTNPLRHTVFCDTTSCCWYEMRVCKDEFGRIMSAEQLNSPTSPVNCPVAHGDSCLNFCDFLLQKNGAFEPMPPRAPLASSTVIQVVPNPAVSNITLTVDYVQRGDFTFELIDVNGRVLVTDQFHSSGVQFVREYDVRSVPTGIYTYRLLEGGRRIGSGQLNVYR